MIKKIYLTLISIKNISIFIFDFFGFKNNQEILYKTRNGMKLAARGGTTDKAEIAVIFSDFEYPSRFFPRKNNPLILDLGANIGAFSLYIYKKLEKYNPNIYAIEPDKQNFLYLKKNLCLNKVKNIKSFNIGIIDKDGLGYINTGVNADAYSVSGDSSSVYNKEIKVETLSGFCKSQNINKIDLLKMDIEGGEYIVFKKDLPFIRNNVKNILIEVHGSSQKIMKFKSSLARCNFVVQEVADRNFFVKNLNIKK